MAVPSRAVLVGEKVELLFAAETVVDLLARPSRDSVALRVEDQRRTGDPVDSVGKGELPDGVQILLDRAHRVGGRARLEDPRRSGLVEQLLELCLGGVVVELGLQFWGRLLLMTSPMSSWPGSATRAAIRCSAVAAQGAS
jgi:hypothetical protein